MDFYIYLCNCFCYSCVFFPFPSPLPFIYSFLPLFLPSLFLPLFFRIQKGKKRTLYFIIIFKWKAYNVLGDQPFYSSLTLTGVLQICLCVICLFYICKSSIPNQMVSIISVETLPYISPHFHCQRKCFIQRSYLIGGC